MLLSKEDRLLLLRTTSFQYKNICPYGYGIIRKLVQPVYIYSALK